MERTFSSKEMARIAAPTCEGCGGCCRGMGESILLDPYDADRLAKRLGRPFAELLDREVGMILEDGIIRPHIAMREETDACSFLGTDGRCSIHTDRPGICRLFPLGRSFEGGTVSYFVLEGACEVPGKSKIKVNKWLGIPKLEQYEAYKLAWHEFMKRIRGRLINEADEGEVKRVNMFLLRTFFLEPYGEDFYAEFGERIARVERLF